MQITALTDGFAAQAVGLDIGAPPSARDAQALQAALDRFAVLVVRDASQDDEHFLAFTQAFGRPQESILVFREGVKRRLGHDHLSDISNVADDGEVMAQDHIRRALQLSNQIWHTDNSFRHPPTKYTFLAARIVTREGGETQVADMRAAYDALSAETKARLEGLTVEHDLARSRRVAGAPDLSAGERERMPAVIQPMVRIHPATGRKSLYIGSHATRVVGWPEEEGRRLLDELEAFATQPRFVYTHGWRDGDILMWDNACTLHRRLPYDDIGEKRDMRRAAVAEDRAVEPLVLYGQETVPA